MVLKIEELVDLPDSKSRKTRCLDALMDQSKTDEDSIGEVGTNVQESG